MKHALPPTSHLSHMLRDWTQPGPHQGGATGLWVRVCPAVPASNYCRGTTDLAGRRA